MPAILTPGFRAANAQSFMASIDSPTNRIYMTIGRAKPWVDDINPPTPEPSSIIEYWDDIIAARRVTGGDTILACRRVDWKSGQVYTPAFNEVVDAVDSYVLSSEYNVYKCISNNGGAPSTVMPTGQGLSVFNTADEYKWKYLLTVTPSDATRFLTSNHIPVRENALVTAAAVPGTIDYINVTEPGVAYTSATVVIEGDGTGAVATAEIIGGQIQKIVMVETGTGYTYATAQIIGNGFGAELEPYLPPVLGHGSNVSLELGVYTVLIGNLFEPNLTNFPTANDYRRLMYIQNPLTSLTNQIATGLTYNFSHTVGVTHVSGSSAWQADEVVTNASSGARFVIVSTGDDVPATQLTITYETPHQLAQGDTFVTAAGGLWTVTDPDLVVPAIKRLSGQVMFVEHRRPIMRAADQIENIVTAFEF